MRSGGSNARWAAVLICGGALLVACSSGSTTSWQNGPAVAVPTSSSLVQVAVSEIDAPVAIDGDPAANALRSQWIRSGPAVSQQWAASGSGPSFDRGYVVGVTSQISVALPARLPAVTDKAVTVRGHPAVLSTAATVPDASSQIDSRLWISWRLGDGLYIHVWSDGDAQSLLTFASTFVERTTTISRSVVLGLAFPGMTQTSGGRDRRASSLMAAWTKVCPQHAAIRSWFGGAAADDSHQCVGATVLQGSSAQEGAGPMNGPDVTVDGLQVFTSPNHSQATAQSGNAWVYVQAPYKARADGAAVGNLTPPELAALVASVRFDPGIVLTD